MGRLGGGTCNSSFNGRAHSFHKSRRIRTRLVKKAAGAKDKHLSEIVARKQTKKLHKRRSRDERLRAKEEELVEASMDVDGPQGSSKKTVDERLGLALKKVGAGKKKYRKFLGKGSAQGAEETARAGKANVVRMSE